MAGCPEAFEVWHDLVQQGVHDGRGRCARITVQLMDRPAHRATLLINGGVGHLGIQQADAGVLAKLLADGLFNHPGVIALMKIASCPARISGTMSLMTLSEESISRVPVMNSLKVSVSGLMGVIIRSAAMAAHR